MKFSELLLPELRIEAATTRRVLERLPEPSFSWRPDPRSRTLGELGGHIANLPGLFIARLGEAELDRASYSSSTGTPGEILEVFDRNVAEGEAAIQSLTDEEFLMPWRYRYGERIVFELPRLVVVRTTALNHLIHHRGQLSVYLRLLGVAVPGIYGPSADEP